VILSEASLISSETYSGKGVYYMSEKVILECSPSDIIISRHAAERYVKYRGVKIKEAYERLRKLVKRAIWHKWLPGKQKRRRTLYGVSDEYGLLLILSTNDGSERPPALATVIRFDDGLHKARAKPRRRWKR